MIIKPISIFVSVLILLAFTACDDKVVAQRISTPLKPFDDVRAVFEDNITFEAGEYNKEDMITLTFNEGTVFEGNEALAKEIIENGKNPGLGIRGLHDEGITGKGVNVAIIDQNMLLDHPEFSGKIQSYYDTGCGMPKDEGSMHAPAVTSILVGSSIGVAPDANVYFASAPSWKADSKYYAEALKWIIKQNRELPDENKIRVVSISAAPSGEGSPFEKNHKLYEDAVLQAQNEGILVLDCRTDDKTGIIAPAYYDTANPEDVEKCKTGWPTSESEALAPKYIAVPCSYRTLAEEYTLDSPSYQYFGQGGLSWSIPYAAGVLALGWQINPELSNEAIIDKLRESSLIDENGSKIINPPEFIDMVRKSIDSN